MHVIARFKMIASSRGGSEALKAFFALIAELGPGFSHKIRRRVFSPPSSFTTKHVDFSCGLSVAFELMQLVAWLMFTRLSHIYRCNNICMFVYQVHVHVIVILLI